MIKAIPVKYKGVWFKSKLEARWAIFFDSLHVEWNYELESFELPTKWYVPDFWLPELRIWFEVKPAPMSQEEKIKARELCEATGYAVLVSDGMPRVGLQGSSFIYQAMGQGDSIGFPNELPHRNDVINNVTLVEETPFIISRYPENDREVWLFLKDWFYNIPCWRDADGVFHPYMPREPFCWGWFDDVYESEAIEKEACEWMMRPHIDKAAKAQFDNKGRYIPM
jgi:hypothetical protein